MKIASILFSALMLLTACGGSGLSYLLPAQRYSVGGAVTGLSGSVGLAFGEENLTVTSSGSFQFTGTQPSTVRYDVTVRTQPLTQECSVTNGSGTIDGANITNVQVNCADKNWYVSTFAGSTTGELGDVNAALDVNNNPQLLTVARFNQPSGISFGGVNIVTANRLYRYFFINDSGNQKIKIISLEDNSNYAAGISGTMNGYSSANTNGVWGMIHPLDHTYLSVGADASNSSILKIPDSNSSAAPTTFATGMNNPKGMVKDAAGNLYVADHFNFVIKKITSSGAVTVFAGSLGNAGTDDGQGTAAKFNGPWGLAIDSDQNIYVADTYSNNIRKITPAGLVSTLAGSSTADHGSADGTGSAARFQYPKGVAVDTGGNVYVADTYNNTIRKITPAGVVTTVAGLAGNGNNAYVNGIGSVARFNRPEGIAIDEMNNLYVADFSNNAIRLLQYRIARAGD